MLDLLDRAEMKASFFLVGERIGRHGALVREIVARGHAVENHSHRHAAWFACYGPARMRREIIAHVDGGGAGLSATARDAIRLLARP